MSRKRSCAGGRSFARLAANDDETYFEQPVELDPLDDGGSDDEEAADLIVGDEIDLLGESLGDNEPVELDLGTLVGFDDAQRATDDENEAGFEVDRVPGLALPDALTPDDGAEGIDDGAITVDESKFPRLEMDDGAEGLAAEREISLGTASDEAAVPRAATLWHTQPSSTLLEACTALAVGADAVVAGSSDLLWFRRDSATPLRVAVDGSTLSDLVLCGANQDIALASTQTGQLFRRARFASQAEQLTRFRDPLKAAPTVRNGMSFGGSLAARNGRILLWTHDGAVLDVLDSGDRFERLEFDGKAIAIARESPTVLLARGRTRTLLELDQGPGHSQPLTGSALLVAQGATVLLATSRHAQALAEYGGALLVSPDRGQSFRRVPGGSSVTALTGAELSGQAVFFAAVYRETSDETEILLIDPELGAAVCVARLDASSEHASALRSDHGEWAKVARLSWHTPSARLWATGGFGVASFSSTELS